MQWANEMVLKVAVIFLSNRAIPLTNTDPWCIIRLASC